MSSKFPIIRFLFAAVLACLAGRLSAQVTDIDTSDYMPLFFDGALEYNLTVAAALGYSSQVERFIKAGAEVDAENSQGATPLFFAILNKKPETVKTLIKYGADINKSSLLNENPLLLSLNVEDLEIAEILIRSGADINYQNRYGATPLHLSSAYGLFDFADLLLYYDADIDRKDDDGTTPLMAAVWAGFPDIADLLIQHGANLEARDNDGFTPFLIAAQNGDTLIMNMLHKKGVDIYSKNIFNWDALALTIRSNHIHATEFLIKTGDRWGDPGREVVSPYNIAAKYRRSVILELLNREKIPGRYQPHFDQMILSVSAKFNARDFYSGFSLSFKEPLRNIGVVTGFDTKLWYTRVLKKESEDLYYQYLDKSSMVYAGAFKDFVLTDNIFRSNFYLSTSLSAGYSFGNKLKGTDLSPGNRFRIIPSASLKWVKNKFLAYTSLEYTGSEFYRAGPFWIRAGCSFSFFFDPDRAPGKIIKWY
ncbi:MAG TPA: hypothetical protein DDW27_19900 [Bacteroidales bacterium]|nr:hypothetical protein [Bacteroidales bacterium]